MRWPGANLEEKHEPRGVSVAEAQNHDSMKSSGQNLTLAAIEKQSFYIYGRTVGFGSNGRDREPARERPPCPRKPTIEQGESIVFGVPEVDSAAARSYAKPLIIRSLR